MTRKLVIFAVYLLLIVLGIPWYWPIDSTLVLFGMPGWVFVAIVVSVLTSVFTAYLLLSHPWLDQDYLDD